MSRHSGLSGTTIGTLKLKFKGPHFRFNKLLLFFSPPKRTFSLPINSQETQPKGDEIMETKSPTLNIQQKTNTKRANGNNMKRSSSSNSDSPHSPHRFHSPLRSDQGDPDPPDTFASPDASPLKSPRNHDDKPNSKAIVAVADKFTQSSPMLAEVKPAVMFNKAVREDGAPSMMKTEPGGVGGGRSGTVLKRSRSEERLKFANLGFRLSEVVLSLISFSVMAADKTQGWSGDSFDRYREYRFWFNSFIHS